MNEMKRASNQNNEHLVQQLVSMGFSRYQATKALELTENNLESAMELIFEVPYEDLTGMSEKSYEENTQKVSIAVDSTSLDSTSLDPATKQLINTVSDVETNDENSRLVCPTCIKPNSLVAKFCTGCATPLSMSHKQQVSANIFLDIISGTDTGTNVILRSEEFLVFDDKFGVSNGHVDVIPTKVIKDITFLSRDHIPLIQKLYELGKAEIEKKNLPKLIGRNFSDYVFFGFNFPVSVHHLHLHVIAAPFKHEKVMQYPRWHSYEKVLHDLTNFGNVRTYDKYPNEKEGKEYAERVLRAHQILSKSIGDQLEETFLKWKESEKNPAVQNLYLVEVTEAKDVIVFNYNTDEFSLKYPTENSPGYSFSGSSRLTWIAEINKILAEKSPQDLCSVMNELTQIFSRPKTSVVKRPTQKNSQNKKNTKTSPNNKTQSTTEISSQDTEEKKLSRKTNEKSLAGSTGSLSESTELPFDYNIDIDVNFDWMAGNIKNTTSSSLFQGFESMNEWPSNNWFGDCVRKEYLAAQAFCGDDVISIFGNCYISVKISVKIVPEIARALEVDPHKPVFVHFDFAAGFATEKGYRVSMPKFTVSQDLKNQYGTDFGVKYHLASVVNSYVEENWKWSGTADILSRFQSSSNNKDKGSNNISGNNDNNNNYNNNSWGMKFEEDKGHNTNFTEWQKKKKDNG